MSNRDKYKYHFKIGNKIVYSGITNDLDRRESEHQNDHPKGHIRQVGRRTTENAARAWKDNQPKAAFATRTVKAAPRTGTVSRIAIKRAISRVDSNRSREK